MSSNNNYPCPFCFEDFLAPSEALLLNHIQLVYSSDLNFSFQCLYDGCSKSLQSFQNLPEPLFGACSGSIREQNRAESVSTSLNDQNPESDDVPEPAEEVFAPTLRDMQS